jgi:serine/threonine-protein kinase
VLPNLAKNKKFIAMFLDEARLSLYLNHANVVQTFDIGVSGETYFIVMEFVDGSNLKSILEIAQDKGVRIPQEQAAYIGIEVCKGLSHAHSRKDPQGRPLGIVHRDISPPNILLSREGEVKLVDFGVAKSKSRMHVTRVGGLVKGKTPYLSPEQFGQLALDRRSDIFSIGTLLWEMTTGARLFAGDNEIAIINRVAKADVPLPTSIRPDYPPQLETIVMRAAALAGPPTAEVFYEPRTEACVVRRFDRQWRADGTLARRVQYDLCQLAGTVSDRKYEKEGGVCVTDAEFKTLCLELADKALKRKSKKS